VALKLADEQLALDGVPAGLVARPLREHRAGPDGALVEVKTRTRLAKLERVELTPAGAATAAKIDAAEERWLLNAGERRWPAIESRYGRTAMDRAVQLARAGVVRLRCRVDDRLTVELPPTGWALTDAWQQRRADADRLRALEREQWRARAAAASRRVSDRCPPLADALRAAAAGSPTLPVLVYAAEDLAQGVAHAGPRAFSQAHFGHTKARDDVSQILRDAGVDEDTLIRLGVRRSSRIGLAGPIVMHARGEQQIPISALDGPVLVRSDQPGLVVRLAAAADLVVVENLQAAETLADQIPALAIVYTAGVPGEPALALVAQLARDARRVLLVPDADLGGVRIAERILRAAPTAELIDIGTFPHPPGEPWTPDGTSIRGLNAALADAAAMLASACLVRGYPVEQELATIDAVQAARSQSTD
jgi:hypothetical protein